MRKGTAALMVVATLALVIGSIGAATWKVFFSKTETPLAFDNLIVNGSFEAGQSNNVIDTIRWTDGVGPLFNLFGSVYTADGWQVVWREGDTCPDYTPDETARPEARLATTAVDPYRVHSGDQALSLFTFYHCHAMGALQHVNIVTGTFDLTAYAHSMYTSCSSQPHGPPLAADCETPLADSWDRLRVGIDPTGGIDPNAPSVVWSTPVEQYGVYGQQIVLRGVELDAGTVTVFLWATCNYPSRHNDVYWDDVELVRVHRLWLPLVGAGE